MCKPLDAACHLLAVASRIPVGYLNIFKNTSHNVCVVMGISCSKTYFRKALYQSMRGPAVGKSVSPVARIPLKGSHKPFFEAQLSCSICAQHLARSVSLSSSTPLFYVKLPIDPGVWPGRWRTSSLRDPRSNRWPSATPVTWSWWNKSILNINILQPGIRWKN